MILSFRKAPDVLISDIPDMIAKHAEKRMPGFFKPYDGRVAEPTPHNIALAKDNNLSVDIPWLNKVVSTDADRKGFRRLSLYDAFHERNSRVESEVLRRTRHVARLAGLLNTEVAEQLHRSLVSDRYFLNTMTPSNHIFLFRTIINEKNEQKNLMMKTKLQDQLRMDLRVDGSGILSAGNFLFFSCMLIAESHISISKFHTEL